MKFIEILNQIKETLGTFGGVRLSFGEPMKLGESSIIPVAKVSMGLGGGVGSSPVVPKKNETESEKPCTNEGGCAILP